MTQESAFEKENLVQQRRQRGACLMCVIGQRAARVIGRWLLVLHVWWVVQGRRVLLILCVIRWGVGLVQVMWHRVWHRVRRRLLLVVRGLWLHVLQRLLHVLHGLLHVCVCRHRLLHVCRHRR